MLLDAFVHWLHLMAAVVWIGGMIFTSMVLQPAMREALAPDIRMPVYRDIGQRFKAVQMDCLGVLFATGIFKFWQLRETPEVFLTPFGTVLGVKLTLVVLVLILSALHSYRWGPKLVALARDPRSADYATVMRRLVFWGRINLALGMAVIFCAALLRFNPF